MGLHICYDLTLPGAVPQEDAIAILERLREFAEGLGVALTTPVFRLTGADLAAERDVLEHRSVSWLMRICSEGMREERDGTRDAVVDPDALAVAGFLMHPGDGSESAMFGLVRPALTTRPLDAERGELWQDWFWHYCCKTQYASRVSDEHLVHCHLSVVHMLEAAKRFGLGVEVRDETHYWETRSTERLVAEVRNMNRIVARFAGAMSDALSPGHRTEGAIFDHPDFERLETEPLD
jgi:hypothetical protein